MTVTARTAVLIINTKRAQFDALLRAKYASDAGQSAPARVEYLSNIGLLVYPEALRWASERAFKIGTTSCGPACVASSSSTLAVVAFTSAGWGTR